MNDTIFALATAPGRSAIAILRGTGAQSRKVLKTVAGKVPPPRHAVLRAVRNSAGDELDQAMALWLPGPGSYTGEDSFELHVHGGPAVVEAVSSALSEAGARPAEPGEFTRRAFENGRLDLAQAEAVADLIDAETEGQRRQALEQLEGGLGQRHERWRALIVDVLAMLDAAVDFPDEELPTDLAARALPGLDELARELRDALDEAQRGERVRRGYRIALVGAPNAGKSSLINRLIGREAAIVTPEAGTTRDVIEAPLVISGYKALLADTAGLRATSNLIEAEGVRRARAWAEAADLRMLVVDPSGEQAPDAEASGLLRKGDIVVLNKSDIRAAPAVDRGTLLAEQSVFTVSALTGAGLDELRDAMAARVVADLGGASFPAGTRERHRAHIAEALSHVGRAREALSGGPELAAEDVRLAGRALEQITGRVGVEQVLDRVFSAFCIGK